MNRGTLAKWMFAALASAFLMGCGGGDGADNPLSQPVQTVITPVEVDPVLAILLLSDLANLESNVSEVNGQDAAFLRAHLEDGDGKALDGVLITFSSTKGQLTPSDGSAVTNTDGVASVSLGSGTVEGAGLVSANARVDATNFSSNEIAFSTDGKGSAVGSAQYTLDLTLSPSTITRDAEGTATLTVTGLEAGEEALVLFTATRGVLESATQFTAGGVATTQLLAGTNAGSGTFAATVTVGNETLNADSVSFITAGDSAATLGLEIDGTTSRTAHVSQAGAAQTVVATVIDERGVFKHGAIVQFTLSGSSGELTRTQHITNESGQATTTILPGTVVGFGAINALTLVDGEEIGNDADEEITFSSAGDGPFEGEGTSNLVVSLKLVDVANPTVEVDKLTEGVTGMLVATVTDLSESPVPQENIIVQFSADIGDLFPGNGRALTDPSGLATARLSAGSVPGAGRADVTILIDNQLFGSDSLTFETDGNAGDTPIAIDFLLFSDATPEDPSTGNNIITTSQPAGVTIRITDGSSGLPLRTATISSTLDTLVSVSGSAPAEHVTAVSDANGNILVDLTAGPTVGQGKLSVLVGSTASSLLFDVGIAGLQIGICEGNVDAVTGAPLPFDCTGAATFEAGKLFISDSPISAGGTASIGLLVTDIAGIPQNNIDITFASICSSQNDPVTGLPLASVSPTAESDASGAIEATFEASGCVEDEITATETSSGETAVGSIDIFEPIIGSIKFDSVVVDPGDPSLQNIQIKESGGISSAQVVFQLLDVFGDPVPDEEVTFELTSNVGGLTLEKFTDLTDDDGKAVAFVNAGFVPTSVRVRASLAVDSDNSGDKDKTLVTLSGLLSVNTGVPDQNSMAIAATILALEGLNREGETTRLTARMSDAFNNPVPDGTAVTFRTELGSIGPSCVTTSGSCGVDLIGTEPRGPTDPNIVPKDLNDTDPQDCPNPMIIDEEVVIDAAGYGFTEYVVEDNPANFFYSASTTNGIFRVESEAQLGLVGGYGDARVVTSDPLGLGVDIVDPAAFGGGGLYGIQCTAGDPVCIVDARFRISYQRKYLDEDADSTSNHDISNPGRATAPFRPNFGPCISPSRPASDSIAGYPGGAGQLEGGRATVMAFALGEESFVDSNGNGTYDFGEPFVDLPEAFLDINEDGVFGNGDPASDDSRDNGDESAVPLRRKCYGPASPITNPSEVPDTCYQVGGDEETFIDFGIDPEIAGPGETELNNKFDAGNGIYNGTLCPKDVSDEPLACDNVTVPCVEGAHRYCTRELVNIRRSIQIGLAGSFSEVGIRDVGSGEYVSRVIATTDMFFPGELRVERVGLVVYNHGGLVPVDTDFNIGWADTDVPPTSGDIDDLIGAGSVWSEISDRHNQGMPVGSTVSFTSGTNGCEITNSPAFTVANGTRFDRQLIDIGPASNPITGGAGIEVKVIANASKSESGTTFLCTY